MSLNRVRATYQQQLEDWSKAYTDLETAHKKTSIDLENMSRNHNSLKAQLDEASRCYDLSVQQYKRELQENLDKLRKEKEGLVREHRDALAAAEDHATIAKKRVIELEEQHSHERQSLGGKIVGLETKVKSIRKDRDALAGALEAAEKKIAELKQENADLIQDQDVLAPTEETAEKRISGLEEENSHLIQEHRDEFADVEDRGMVVVERIAEPEKKKELENMRLTAESGASAAESLEASPESIPSSNTRKRPRFGSQQDGDMQQQCRKVRGRKAAEVIEGDTIIVQTE